MIEIEVQKKFIIGVISDTHGLMRPEIKNIFKNANLIIHAGDIGDAGIIKALSEIAPVLPVKGNIDIGDGLDKLPSEQTLRIGIFRITVVHNIMDADLKAVGSNEVLIFGHSHKPSIENRNKAVLFNPGSAGRKRFSLPVSAGIIAITPKKIRTEIIYL